MRTTPRATRHWENPPSTKPGAIHFAGCGNGTCLLDLRKNGSSCFYSLTDCDGWFTAANRNSVYECWYGTNHIALNECYLYAPTFSPANAVNGHAYADPATGDLLTGKTSPDQTDRLADQLYNRPAGYLRVYDKSGAGTTAQWATLDSDKRRGYARTIAWTCVAQNDDCSGNIWIPGADVSDVSLHDAQAIASGQPAVLTALSQADRENGFTDANGTAVPGLKRGWYTCTAPRPDNADCDEYPYYATAESSTSSDIDWVNSRQNRREGALRQWLLYGPTSGCGLLARSDLSTRRYIVLPIVILPTIALCDGDS